MNRVLTRYGQKGFNSISSTLPRVRQRRYKRDPPNGLFHYTLCVVRLRVVITDFSFGGFYSSLLCVGKRKCLKYDSYHLDNLIFCNEAFNGFFLRQIGGQVNDPLQAKTLRS